jgi:hypothetical protein
VSIITGIGAINLYTGELTSRYHASNLGHGETAQIMAIASMYYFLISKYNHKIYLGVAYIVLLLSTGNRKEIFFIIFIIFIHLLRNNWDNKVVGKKFKNRISETTLLLPLLFISVLIILLPYLAERFSMDRYTEMLTNLTENGVASFFSTDDSAEGRWVSIIAGISVIKLSPILGLSFSCYDMQYNLNLFDYPSFPHNTIVFYWCVLGAVTLYIVYVYLVNWYKLIINKSKFQYIVFYLFLHNGIAGGAYLNFKSIFLYLFILNMAIFINRTYDKKKIELQPPRRQYAKW